MPARLVLPAPRPVSELEARYRGARDPVTRSHYQIVWLLANGEPTATVASAPARPGGASCRR
jgi:hypothetical protein